MSLTEREQRLGVLTIEQVEKEVLDCLERARLFLAATSGARGEGV